MKIKHLILYILIASFLIPNTLLATSWANEFVVWEGYAYVVNDEYVPETEIDRKIGHVTKYSDMETYTGNYSNAFKKGTKYYSIRGISKDEAIAVQDIDGKYKKATRNGKFEGDKKDNSEIIMVMYIGISLVVILGIYLLRTYRHRVRNN